MVANPFTAGEVIKDPKKFIGRDEIIEEIIVSLTANKKIMLYGQRGVGKSSILYRLEQELESSMLYMPVYIDLHGKLTQPLDNLIRYIAHQVWERCKLGERLPKEVGSDPVKDFQHWLAQALLILPEVAQPAEAHTPARKTRKSTLLLLLDGFDDANQLALPQTAAAFYRSLAGWLVELNELQLVVALARFPEDLSDPARDALVWAHPQRIPLMSWEEIDHIIRLSAPYLHWSYEAQEKLWELTKGHPLLVQTICSNIWDQNQPGVKSRRVYVKDEDVEKFRLAKSWDYVIQHAWDNLYAQEQVLLNLIAVLSDGASKLKLWQLIEEKGLVDSFIVPDSLDQKRVEDEFLPSYRLEANDYFDALLDNLELADWLEQDFQYHYSIKIPIFREWVASHYKFDTLAAKLSDRSKHANELFLQANEADDLAESIHYLESAVALDPDNPSHRKGLQAKLIQMIDLCLQERNISLAEQYARLLSKYESALAQKYLGRIDAVRKKQTDSFEQKLYLQSSAELIGTSVQVLGFISLNWIRDAFFWLPIWVMITGFHAGVFGAETTRLSEKNTIAQVILVFASILIAIIETAWQQSAHKSRGTSSWANLLLYTIVNFSAVAFLIQPNLTSLPEVIAGEKVLYLIPFLSLLFLFLRRLDLITGTVAALANVVFTYWICYLNGDQALTPILQVVQSNLDRVGAALGDLLRFVLQVFGID